MIQQLNLIKHNSLVFVWTKAHVGNAGNEKADLLAKAGTTMDQITEIPPPACELKAILDHRIRAIWQQE